MSSQKIPALDLSKEAPRSPRATLAGYVIAGRTLDKCRAVIAGTEGAYHFNCPLDQCFLHFAGIDAERFKAVVASGADDAGVEAWIEENATEHSEAAIIQWNNDLRYKRISELPIELQVFLEGYIPEYLPENRVVYHWFDVYDIEEGRI